MNHTSRCVTIHINGEAREIPSGMTVSELLRELGLTGKPVAVERNFEVVPVAKHAVTQLHPGDQLEIVTLVGGG